MKKYIFPFLVGLSALSLAGAAAFFSVTGLSKLFGGAKMEVIIMASALELAKLVTASFLHRYWKTLKWQIKTYLTVGVVTVMLITSAGIYGFLSNAYSTTSGKLQNIDAQVQMVDQKKTIINSEITRLQENKNLKSDRVKSLVNLRAQQEARVDSLYNRRQTASAKRVELQIEQASLDIAATNIEIDTLNAKVQRKYGEISALDMEILNLKNNDVNGEVGPLRYIAKLTGKDMDSVVNFFILLLIFVFDPLAVSLVIATNISIQREFGKKEDEEESKPEPIREIIAPVEEKIEEVPVEEIKEPITQEISEKTEEISEDESLKKTEEVIRYVADEKGEFKAESVPVVIDNKEPIRKVILEQLKAQGIEHNSSYLSFLDVLFKNGTLQVGTLLQPYNLFLEEIKAVGLKYTEKEVKDFLTICNLFKITDMSGPDKKIAKEYAVAKEIISLLSK
jgi:hypothetical protein